MEVLHRAHPALPDCS